MLPVLQSLFSIRKVDFISYHGDCTINVNVPIECKTDWSFATTQTHHNSILYTSVSVIYSNLLAFHSLASSFLRVLDLNEFVWNKQPIDRALTIVDRFNRDLWSWETRRCNITRVYLYCQNIGKFQLYSYLWRTPTDLMVFKQFNLIQIICQLSL